MSLALLSRDDRDYIAALAGCTLRTPGAKENWVDEVHGLPDYICRIARAILRSGKMTKSQAIATAVSRVKVWASGKGVSKDTQGKAAAALAEWEQKRGESKAKTAAKDTAKVAASHTDTDILALTDYPVQLVVDAFNDRTRAARTAWRQANPNASYDDPNYPQSLWVKEQWNTFLIVQSDYGRNPDLYKVPYTVDDDNNVTFGEPTEVKSQYVEITDADDTGSDITDEALQKMMAACGPCPKSAVDKLLSLTTRPTGLARILSLAAASDPDNDGDDDTNNSSDSDDDATAKSKAMPLGMFADPGYQSDGKPRYRLNSPAQVKHAHAQLNQKLNASKYKDWQLAHLKANVKAAASKHNLDLTALTHAAALEKVLALAQAKSGEYANTKAENYADPGYQSDGKKRYALDTESQVRAAWSYINQKDNAGKYSPADLAKVKARIKAAAKKFDIEISDNGD